MDTTAIYCQNECRTEGLWDPASDVLYCDDCGWPAVVRAKVNLAKSVKRNDNLDILANYAKVYANTFAAAERQKRLPQ